MYSSWWNPSQSYEASSAQSLLVSRNPHCELDALKFTYLGYTLTQVTQVNPSQAGRCSIYLPRRDGRLS